ncbi:MAG: hypothetical protein L0H93_14280 [Nocardioides sp.]|nr:hypothetical protein [Nocardioides sp.]
MGNETATEHREAASDLVAATRELMRAAATTAVNVDTMRAAIESLGELSRELGKESRPRVVHAPFDGPATALAAGAETPWRLFRYNPQGMEMDVYFDGETVRSRVQSDALFEGPRDAIHGGFSAHMLDCVLGILMQARGIRALTASLELRYLERVPLDEPLDLCARIVDTTGRKTVAEGWIEVGGRRTVEARGLFIAVSEERQEVPA